VRFIIVTEANLKIFSSMNRIFLKIQYFPSEIFVVWKKKKEKRKIVTFLTIILASVECAKVTMIIIFTALYRQSSLHTIMSQMGTWHTQQVLSELAAMLCPTDFLLDLSSLEHFYNCNKNLHRLCTIEKFLKESEHKKIPKVAVTFIYEGR